MNQNPSGNATPPRSVDQQQACSGEVVHGFTLPPGQDASSCEWWPEFSEYFERVEGFTPHPRDTHHRRLFEYFVEGAFRQHQQSQNAKEMTPPLRGSVETGK